MDVPHTALFLALGASLGFLGGLFGIGGGIVAVPVLVLVFGMEQATAQGTALVTMVPNLFLGWFRYSRKHPTPLRSTVLLAALACTTTWLTARFAAGIDQRAMGVLFCLLLIAVAVQGLWRRPAGDGHTAPRLPWSARWTPLVSVVGGASMGLLGMGGGLVATPIFTGKFGLRQTVAQSLSLALVTPSAVIALLTYHHAGRVDWGTGGALALGGLATVSAGVAVAHGLPEARMRKAFSWMLLATALWMLVRPLVFQ